MSLPFRGGGGEGLAPSLTFLRAWGFTWARRLWTRDKIATILDATRFRNRCGSRGGLGDVGSERYGGFGIKLSLRPGRQERKS